jgi:hypothetical protein
MHVPSSNQSLCGPQAVMALRHITVWRAWQIAKQRAQQSLQAMLSF